jgi:hypothetical protein
VAVLFYKCKETLKIMETKKITTGYVGLMGAKETISKQLRKMIGSGIPLKFEKIESGQETTLIFSANGISATFSIKEGGQV